MKRRARTGDPLTSHEAAASASQDTLSRIETLTLNIFRTGLELTDEELVKVYTFNGYPGTPQAVRTARNELSRQEKLILVGIGKTTHGRNARIWSINL